MAVVDYSIVGVYLATVQTGARYSHSWGSDSIIGRSVLSHVHWTLVATAEDVDARGKTDSSNGHLPVCLRQPADRRE
jgi:hypothetical protein